MIGFWTRPEANRYLLMVGFLLRRRAELIVLTVTVLVFIQLDHHVTPGLPGWMTPAEWALLIMAATLTVVVAVPVSRRYVWGRCRAVIIRHRLRTCFVQTRTWTTNGRLPFLLWSRPSRVGERVRVWLPAGLSVKHLERIQDELAAACWAHEVRIVIVRTQAALVLLDVVRHDPLATRRAITPPVAEYGDDTDSDTDTGRPSWLPDPSELDDPPIAPDKPVLLPEAPASIPAILATTPAPDKGTPRPTRTSTPDPAAEGRDGQAEQPAVTGFGGVDVTDYV